MKSIAVIINARTNSSRCPNKLLRSFGGSNLVTIALEKLGRIKCDEKFFCIYHDEFKNIKLHPDITILLRSLESVSVDGPLTKVFECLLTIQSDYFMFLNPCCAHVRIDTIQMAIDQFKQGNCQTMTSVLRVRDWLYRTDGTLIVDASVSGDTKATPETLRVAHAFHILDRKSFFSDGKIWHYKKNDPCFFEIDKIEAIDVDDENDFFISESVYAASQNRSINAP